MFEFEGSAYSLAHMADVASPDSLESPGAQFLHAVLDATREAYDDKEDPQEAAHQIADDAVPIYTRDIWTTFVDLCAYNEDTSDYGDSPDMEQNAKLALYQIAERLAVALFDEQESGDDE